MITCRGLGRSSSMIVDKNVRNRTSLSKDFWDDFDIAFGYSIAKDAVCMQCGMQIGVMRYVNDLCLACYQRDNMRNLNC